MEALSIEGDCSVAEAMAGLLRRLFISSMKVNIPLIATKVDACAFAASIAAMTTASIPALAHIALRQWPMER